MPTVTGRMREEEAVADGCVGSQPHGEPRSGRDGGHALEAWWLRGRDVYINRNMTEADIQFMRRAMTLAQRGAGGVNPNPLVGAVLVADGTVVGEGWHERFGGPHAERNALARATGAVRGATLYVTLEPCCHYGKTPPCTEAIIDAGLARVVVGLQDPNPLVAGRGVATLRQAGIAVECGAIEDELRWQNRVFLKYITTHRPWVVLKTAMTIDGKIATRTGDSRWVTGEAARRRGHEMRRTLMAIAVGIGTALADDPLLTCRLDGDPRQPVRLVVDSSARLPVTSRLVRTARQYRTIVAVAPRADAGRVATLERAGVEVWFCGDADGRVDIAALTARLGEAGIDSLLLEGGGTLAEAFLRAGAVDEVAAFIAPKIVGGAEAKTPVEGRGVERMAEATALDIRRVERCGDDIMISASIKR